MCLFELYELAYLIILYTSLHNGMRDLYSYIKINTTNWEIWWEGQIKQETISSFYVNKC